MSFPPVPNLSRGAINKAGKNLLAVTPGTKAHNEAIDIVGAWRVAHAYPINTFNTTLRNKIKKYNGLVAQRLKRLPTIIDKLERYPQMDLVRMQDIGGVRGILTTVNEVREIEKQYRDSKRFTHTLHKAKDYISEPKEDGYRGIHLVYKYNNALSRNKAAIQYKGLFVELQLRTKLQHSWATAVETVGTLRGEGFKSGRGDKKWREFFALTSSIFSILEKTQPLPQYVNLNIKQKIKKLIEIEDRLKILGQIEGFSLAANFIDKKGFNGFYNLIILRPDEGSLEISPYKKDQILEAAEKLSEIEKEQIPGKRVDAVIVSAGRLKSLRRAYPNYFLDVRDFVRKIKILVKNN